MTQSEQMIEDAEERDDIEDVSPAAEETDDKEARARKQGWRSEEDWDPIRAEKEGRRKPAKFLTAEEFLDRADNELPIMRSTLKKMEGEIGELRKKGTEQDQFIKEQQKFHRESIERVRAEERNKIKEGMRVAAAEGDMDTHDEAMAKLEKLDEETRKQIVEEAKKEAPASATAAQTDPVIDGWVAQNPWFTAKGKKFLNELMISEDATVRETSPTLGRLAQLEAAKRRVMQRFPEEFDLDLPRGGRLSAVESPSNRRSASSVESRFSALPAAERAVFDKHKTRFDDINKGNPNAKPYTKEEFLRDYGV